MGLFDMRMICGEVDGETFKRFDALRKDLRTRNLKYEFYFKSKYNTVRVLVNLLVNKTEETLALIDQLEEVKQ